MGYRPSFLLTLLISLASLVVFIQVDWNVSGDGPQPVGTPDVRVVGWTVDDAAEGNGDGGLHPGETAFVQIYLYNQGDPAASSVLGTLSEIVDHPEVENLGTIETWPDLLVPGTPAASSDYRRTAVDLRVKKGRDSRCLTH